jgi:hypothetical protein
MFADALIMEAAGASETPANIYQTTRRYNPEDIFSIRKHRAIPLR